MAPIRTDSPSRHSQRNSKSRPASLQNPNTPSLPANDDIKVESGYLMQKMLRIVDLFEEEAKWSHMEVKSLLTEKKILEQAQIDAEKAQAVAEEAVQDLRRTIEQFTAAHADAAKCDGCHKCIDHPFTLVNCGHTFCFGCLRKWFHKCLLKQLQWRETPAHLKEKLVTAEKLKELFENKYICATRYTYPKTACQVKVENKPIQIGLAGDMIKAVNNIFGPPAHQVDPNPHPNEPNIWADIFYEGEV